MKKPVLLYLVVFAAIAGLGWWAYGVHRDGRGALEIAAPGTPSQAATTRRDDPRMQDPPGPIAPGAAPEDGASRRQAGASQSGGRGPVGVETARAQRVSLVETVAAVGTLRANETVVIKPEIAGRIERINFDGGSQVRKGDLLVALDASVAAAEAEQTRAELSLARSYYHRTADLAAQ
ncbi:MAG: biotin/lipoyl-binding protein [Burkholderiaceae bacterium]